MAYDTPKQHISKRSLIEFGAILRRDGCGHREGHMLCRICSEELAQQITELGEMMLKLRKLQTELESVKTMIPRYMFVQD